jgi:hypothetical protein
VTAGGPAAAVAFSAGFSGAQYQSKRKQKAKAKMATKAEEEDLSLFIWLTS